MIRYADEVFQNVWIELPAGESELSNHILSDADCVIINLTQSPCELAKINKLPRFKKEFYIVGAYEQRNIYAIHNMMLLYPRLRGKCAMIPYHKGFFAACCMGDAESFWMRQMNRENTYASLSFFRAVEKVYMKWKEGWCDDLCGEKEEKTWKDPNLKLLFK